MNITEIKKSNYQSYQNLDIVAFSFAYEGAMGEPGGIYIIDKAGQIYHANYYYGDDCIAREHIKDIIPVFAELKFGIMGCETKNENWVSVDLGFGNSLFIQKTISDSFNEKVKEAQFERPYQLFQHWPGFILGLLGKDESNLTIRNIWRIKKA